MPHHLCVESAALNAAKERWEEAFLERVSYDKGSCVVGGDDEDVCEDEYVGGDTGYPLRNAEVAGVEIAGESDGDAGDRESDNSCWPYPSAGVAMHVAGTAAVAVLPASRLKQKNRLNRRPPSSYRWTLDVQMG
jgi:hypothetical protein